MSPKKKNILKVKTSELKRDCLKQANALGAYGMWLLHLLLRNYKQLNEGFYWNYSVSLMLSEPNFLSSGINISAPRAKKCKILVEGRDQFWSFCKR